MRVEDARPVKREVATRFYGTLVVTISPEGVYLREKGRRTSYLLPYDSAFSKAAQLKADLVRREKLAARKARRSAK